MSTTRHTAARAAEGVAMRNETDNQIRLRRAKEAVAAYQSAEVEARGALASAIESTKFAREKYEELFLSEEKCERARRSAGIVSGR